MSEFSGHPTQTLDNGSLRVEYVTDIGPRIARLFFGKSSNLLGELPELKTETPYGVFKLMGGHRLWHSPEATPRTYIPDQKVKVENLSDGVRLSASTEPATGIAKTMELHLAPKDAVLTIHHELQNDGLWPVELSPWALTVFRLGGTAIFPQPVGNTDPAGLLSNRHLVIWPYTQLQEPRLKLADDFILLKANPSLPPCKIGYANTIGWMGYWIDGVLFVKRLNYFANMNYPDNQCNAETYCNDQFIELETVGPFTKLSPGKKIVHTETWELYDSLNQSFIPDTLLKRLNTNT